MKIREAGASLDGDNRYYRFYMDDNKVVETEAPTLWHAKIRFEETFGFWPEGEDDARSDTTKEGSL